MRYNVLKRCATRVCRACVDETTCVAERYLTLRTGCSRGRTPKVVRPQQRKNPLPFPFSKRSHIGNLRQIRKQGKGRSSKRKGNRRCSFLFAPRGGCRTPPLWFSAAKQKHRRPPVRGVSHYSISSRTENAASCSVLSSLYSISREYALQMQICAQCVTSPLASHSYTSSS